MRYWEQLPADVFTQIIELKRQSMPNFNKSTNNDYEADPYSEEQWLAQFGDKS